MTPSNPLKRIAQLVNVHKKEVVSIYLFSMLSGLINLSLPLGVQTIIGLVMGATMVSSIYVLIFLVVLGVFLVGLLQINQMKIIETIQQRVFANYAYTFADTIPRMDLKKMDHYFIPEKVNRFFDTINIQKGFAKLLLDIPIASVQIIFGILLLSLYHPLFILLGIFLLILLGLIFNLSSKRGISTSIEESNYKYEVVGFFNEMGRTLKSFKFSQGSDLNLEKTNAHTRGYLEARTQHFHVLLFQYKTLIFFKVSLTVLMLTLGTYLLIDQQLNIGEFIAAEIVILMVIGAVEKLITSLDSAYDVITGLEKIASVTESPLEKSGTMELNIQKGLDIQLSNFSFSFDASKKILESINLHIKPGQKVSIDGPEGSGKSMLLRMLTGNYQDFEGSFQLNHFPIQNYALQDLRKNTGVVLHGQEIFGGSLWENISLGQKEITADLILQKSMELGFDDFLSHFPAGFDTIIEPIGKKTPQTIIKKVLLLRALCGPKKLLLLEEPWAGLETKNKEQLKHYLLNLPADTTVIVVSDDADFNRLTDQQIYMRHGKI
ncbi:peptidase domain-containing ABC transporter [Aquirufa regiilacus]|uniref:ATP-binding cassette domain-containing protein n=1 Tax=Aquirufa regiilacus TaxID=3024868 RepID=A0ABU3TU82_9BACT|nr:MULTISPECIES: ATP-binding cassette domain-containing protein [unclassified Aquirufa]MDT8886155.1 ATP-binding cassette domain-containing protein [Aquirufa sp. LEPPI-3A]MDU0809217.1 ATP-binding cassette domain-containing protein [Aquirufa sp. LEOWEIH-7C]